MISPNSRNDLDPMNSLHAVTMNCCHHELHNGRNSTDEEIPTASWLHDWIMQTQNYKIIPTLMSHRCLQMGILLFTLF